MVIVLDKLKKLFVAKDYGKVRLKLDKIMDERGISRNSLAKAVDTRFEVIDKWYNNKVENIDLDILAKICYVLECNVDDIIEYIPEVSSSN